MQEPVDNEGRTERPDPPPRPADEPAGAAGCVSCGHVDSPIRVGPGPGWLALALWAAAAVLWSIGMFAQATWLTYPTAAVFLGALIYTLWYFYKREEACRHCGASWATAHGGGGHP